MDGMPTAEELISRLGLTPHPKEGGYFRETYRAAESWPAGALPARYRGDRAASTAIYYLLTPPTFSALHRLQTDEVFHFYLGDPVRMLQLDGAGQGTFLPSHPGRGVGGEGESAEVAVRQPTPPAPLPEGEGRTVKLGPDVMAGQQLQVVVPRGVWQGSCLEPGGRFALLGCTVAPGFEYADYESGERAQLLAQYPAFADLIRRLTPE
jgi:predicted cupin superfamily sugar epimerase